MAQNQQKITTFITFEGQAVAAMDLYTSVFKDARIENEVRYGVEGPGKEGTIQHAVFSIHGQAFMCSDSFVKHDWDITPGVSLFVHCEDEEEIDVVFTKLSDGGKVLMPLGDYGFGKKFGWVEDPFGVSWQLNLPE
ncbi:VOC family protein [Alkalicoccobacillus porphyridii]|uniref:VOC family protein n=1 Tax=Alkalicoccobacillus porphyridii TaxID=2597270 RepID=A0A554A2J5_9BACI|nr:VOC family protein [Alkalicoccobacillus porphyridii]TSB47913.1 VOC family protein [Alkalicoccobacillus porphyridii]